MSAQHTPGTIRYDYEPGYCGELIASNGATVARFIDEPSEADARRLVACWNACEGLSTEEIEVLGGIGGVKALKESLKRAQLGSRANFASMQQQAALKCELLSALKRALPLIEEYDGKDGPEAVQSRAAIAKVTNQAGTGPANNDAHP